MNLGIAAKEILRITGIKEESRDDLLAVEEPLEIRIGYGPESARERRSISVTMRTPGNDVELAAGFLYTENIITSLSDVISIKECMDVQHPSAEGNVIRAELDPKKMWNEDLLKRNFYMTSSCGVCGKSSIEAVESCVPSNVKQSDIKVSGAVLKTLSNKLREHQLNFKHTGGIHAAGLFNSDGELLVVREDVGRHNAMDKIVGKCLMDKFLPLDQSIILTSGRLSFELVQKVAMAGCSVFCAIGAPSSLAVATADKLGMTLVGFLKDKSYNVYCGQHRIV